MLRQARSPLLVDVGDDALPEGKATSSDQPVSG